MIALVNALFYTVNLIAMPACFDVLRVKPLLALEATLS
jgi:hypothetical protein